MFLFLQMLIIINTGLNLFFNSPIFQKNLRKHYIKIEK